MSSSWAETWKRHTHTVSVGARHTFFIYKKKVSALVDFRHKVTIENTSGTRTLSAIVRIGSRHTLANVISIVALSERLSRALTFQNFCFLRQRGDDKDLQQAWDLYYGVFRHINKQVCLGSRSLFPLYQVSVRSRLPLRGLFCVYMRSGYRAASLSTWVSFASHRVSFASH